MVIKLKEWQFYGGTKARKLDDADMMELYVHEKHFKIISEGDPVDDMS